VHREPQLIDRNEDDIGLINDDICRVLHVIFPSEPKWLNVRLPSRGANLKSLTLPDWSDEISELCVNRLRYFVTSDVADYSECARKQARENQPFK